MILSAGVQVGVIGRIVVALCEKLRLGTVVTPRLACRVCQTGNDGNLPSSELAHYTMHNWNILALHIVHDHLTNLSLLYYIAIPQDKQVSTLERGLHAPREDDDDW